MTRTRHRTRTRPKKGKATQIDRQKRRLLHALWPRLVAGPVGSVGSEINYLLRTQEEGLTPGERAYLAKEEEKLREVHENLMMIYFRLKK